MPPAKKPNPLFLGPFASLEAALAQQAASLKRAHGPLAPLRVLVPTHLLGLHLQRALARHPALGSGHANIRFSTLEDFARELTAPLGLRRAPPLALELLCARIARETISPRRYFAPVRDTRGFHTLLLATFTDLKEAAVSPPAFKQAAKTPKLKELAAAYAEFCSWLTKHDWCTEADVILQAKIQNPKSEIFLFGFYDLNALQRRFVEQLAPAAIFFPFGDEHFGYARPLLDWLTRLGYRSERLPFKMASRACETCEANPKSSIVSAAGETAEAREAIREALAFCRDGHTFTDIAILSRSREPYDPILRDALANLGLRAYFRGGRPLIELFDAKLILLLLETVRTDFSRAAVMELSCHLDSHADWDALSVELGIVGGQTQWLRRVLATANHTPRESDELDRAHLERRQRAAQGLLAFLNKLFTVAGHAPSRGPWAGFTERAIAAWTTLGGKHERVRQTIESLALLDEFDTPVGFDQFAETCARALAQTRHNPEHFQGGGLFVSDVMGARGLSFPLVIVLGLVEKNFPRAVREDPLLLDAERARISPDLPLKQRGQQEEHLLFALANDAAREKIILSYPRLDPATASPRVPSFLLLERVGARNLKELEAKARVSPLSPVAPRDDPLDERELDWTALGALANPDEYASTISPLLPLGLAAERARWGEQKLTAHDGLIASPATLKLLRERFGLDKLVTSATALEKFFFCPFYYFQRYVLGIEPWEEPEAVIAIEARELGLLYHAILEEVFRKPGEKFDAICEKKFREFEGEGVAGAPTVWEIKKQMVREELAAFVARHRPELANWKPSEFEKKFNDIALALPIRLRGRIDRIDVSADGRYARVLDYKTGRAPERAKEDAFAAGEALQLPLYILAAERLFPRLAVESASYLYFTQRGGFRAIRFSREALTSQQNELTAMLQTAADMVRDGTFGQYASEQRCRNCDFRPICGNGIVRLYQGKAGDPRTAKFRAIKETVA